MTSGRCFETLGIVYAGEQGGVSFSFVVGLIVGKARKLGR
jgi:hypothetical protein